MEMLSNFYSNLLTYKTNAPSLENAGGESTLFSDFHCVPITLSGLTFPSFFFLLLVVFVGLAYNSIYNSVTDVRWFRRPKESVLSMGPFLSPQWGHWGLSLA